MNCFKKYYLNVIKNNYLNFAGRASRKDYWMFVLFNFIISIFIIVLSIAFIVSNIKILAFFGGILIGLYILYYLTILIPSLAIAFRRLHDSGKSGWFFLLVLIPFVGSIIILIFYLLPSEKKDNKWGKYIS